MTLITFIGNSSRIEFLVTDTETVAAVKSAVCGKLSLEPSQCTLIQNNKELDPAAMFLSVVVKGPPVIVQHRRLSDEDEEDDDESIDDSLIAGLDEVTHSDDEIPSYTPPNMQDMVASLMEMGPFSQEDCERALRVSYFNVHRAAAFLLDGNIPERPSGYIYDSVESMDGMDLEEKEKEALRRLFNQTKIDIPVLIQYYVACDGDEEKTLMCIMDEKRREQEGQAAMQANDEDEFE